MADAVYDLSLRAGVQNDQYARMAALIANTVRPTPAEVDLMCRAWIDRLGGLAGAAIGSPGVAVYIPLATLEVPDGVTPPADIEAAKVAAADAVSSIQPDATDLHDVAVKVLGTAIATQLGL